MMTDSIGYNDRNFINVNAHELAHQWFGDLVTEKKESITGLTKVLQPIMHYWQKKNFLEKIIITGNFLKQQSS